MKSKNVALSCVLSQLDYGREHVSQLPRPQQLTLAGSPTCAEDDDAQLSLKKSDATSAAAAEHVDRYGVRDTRARPADESGRPWTSEFIGTRGSWYTYILESYLKWPNVPKNC